MPGCNPGSNVWKLLHGNAEKLWSGCERRVPARVGASNRRATGRSVGTEHVRLFAMDLRNPFRHSRLSRVLRRFGGEESGNYAIMAALTMPVVVGLGGLGTEAALTEIKWRIGHDRGESRGGLLRLCRRAERRHRYGEYAAAIRHA